MRDYGKVHTAVWSSPTIRALSDDGKMLAIYLMTSPHSTIAGVFRLPDGYVCEDIKWEPSFSVAPEATNTASPSSIVGDAAVGDCKCAPQRCVGQVRLDHAGVA